MYRYKHRQCRQRGATLLELMFATALGAFVIAAGVALYQHITRHHAHSEDKFAALETAAIVERIVHNELHASSGHPCPHADKFANIVNQGESTYWLDLFNRPAQIYAGNSIGAETIRAHGTRSGDRVIDSDVLVVLTSRSPTTIIVHNVSTGYFDLLAAMDFEHGGFAVVCDRQTAALFQITNISNAGRRLHYTGGTVSPGNCTPSFDTVNTCGAAAPYQFAAAALIAALHPVVLFVGISPGGTRHSLYRERLTLSDFGSHTQAAMRREEIIGGVAAMKAVMVPASIHPRGLDIGIVVTGRHSGGSTIDEPPVLFGETLTAPPDNAWTLSHEFSIAL